MSAASATYRMSTCLAACLAAVSVAVLSLAPHVRPARPAAPPPYPQGAEWRARYAIKNTGEASAADETARTRARRGATGGSGCHLKRSLTTVGDDNYGQVASHQRGNRTRECMCMVVREQCVGGVRDALQVRDSRDVKSDETIDAKDCDTVNQ